MRVNRQLAPGLGDLLPGNFVVPQNPLIPVKYIPKIGEILPSRFSIPSNPLVDAIRKGISGLGGCACGGGSNEADSGTGFLNGKPFAGVGGVMDGLGSVNWWTVGAAVAAVMLISKAKGGRR